MKQFLSMLLSIEIAIARFYARLSAFLKEYIVAPFLTFVKGQGINAIITGPARGAAYESKAWLYSFLNRRQLFS